MSGCWATPVAVWCGIWPRPSIGRAGYGWIAEELRRRGWTEADLGRRRKSDPVKLAVAARLRRETTLTVGWIARRLELGTRKSAAVKLHRWTKGTQEQDVRPAETMV
jgi:hypothetical protein